MRWMLLVDTCGDAGGVAVAGLSQDALSGLTPNELPRLAAERSLPGRATQERLVAAVEEVLAETGLRPNEVDVIAVVTGPGSFTGVRIGVAAAKGLAEALHLPIAGVSRLAVLAAQATAREDVQAWIDAGRGDVFVGHYRGGACLREQMLRGSDAAAMAAGRDVVLMEEQLIRLHPAAQVVPPVGVLQALPLAAAKALRGEFADPIALDANYLRVPDAETARLTREAGL